MGRGELAVEGEWEIGQPLGRAEEGEGVTGQACITGQHSRTRSWKLYESEREIVLASGCIYSGLAQRVLFSEHIRQAPGSLPGPSRAPTPAA